MKIFNSGKKFQIIPWTPSKTKFISSSTPDNETAPSKIKFIGSSTPDKETTPSKIKFIGSSTPDTVMGRFAKEHYPITPENRQKVLKVAEDITGYKLYDFGNFSS